MVWERRSRCEHKVVAVDVTEECEQSQDLVNVIWIVRGDEMRHFDLRSCVISMLWQGLKITRALRKKMTSFGLLVVDTMENGLRFAFTPGYC